MHKQKVMFIQYSGQPKQKKNRNTKTEIIPIQKTEFWPKPNHSAKIAYLAEMTLFLPKSLFWPKKGLFQPKKYFFWLTLQ